MRKINWGVLSTAKIGLNKVIPALQASRHGKVLAIASRTRAPAEAAASQLRIPRVHGSYEALLGDPEIDAVYIPLPNHLHVPWSIKALEAGKHVLCEKPIGLNSQEALQLADAAKRMHEGDLDARARLSTEEDFGQIGAVFDQLATSFSRSVT
jgi:predicted dehydrogenase